MNNKKDKIKFNILNLFDETYNGITMQGILVFIYLVLMLGVYPIITDNKYFNITVTKYNFFFYTTVLYVALALVVSIVEGVINSRYRIQTIRIEGDIKSYKRPEFWMEAFMLANVFAYMVSIDRSTSLLGEGVRYMGVVTYVVIALMFMVIASGKAIHKSLFFVFTLSGFYAYIIAIFQHIGIDFMGYRDRISIKQYNIYISTFGNINIFAGFLAISIPVFACVYIFVEKKLYRYISALMLFLGGMCLMAANSDSGFFGVAVASFLVVILAVKDMKIREFADAVAMLFSGVLLMVIFNKIIIDFDNDRGGVAVALEKIPLIAVLTFIVALIWLGARIMWKRYEDALKKLDMKKLIKNIIIITVALVVVVVIIGMVLDLSVFTFNYKWGNYRGMIWQISVDIYKDAPMVNKIFGYGNETLEILTRRDYYDIMMENTKRIYDNAHNEVLQYLVTTGIVGAVSYVGFFISGFCYILKNAGGKIIPYASLVAVTGYFVQGLVNINQPITTPYYFLFMAVGIGYIRYAKKQEAYNDKGIS